MNPFSQLLESFVSRKKANISQMASFCGIDRSSMYKIVHGTRKPNSSDLVCDICRFLKLSPEESDLLMKKYMIQQIGVDNYKRRQSVLSFMQACFAGTPDTQSVSFEKFFTDKSDGKGASCVLHGFGNVINAFGFIVQKEMKRTNGHVAIRMQPDPRFAGLLMTLSRCTDLAEGFRTEQIIALSGSNTPPEDSAYNLDLIKNILPLCNGFSFYDLYYYYTNMHTGRTHFSFLPGAVITDEYVLQVSEDKDFAILHSLPETITFFRDLFAHLKDACMQLTRSVRDYRDLLYNGKRRNVWHAPISFQMFPSLNYFLTEDLLEKYLHPDLQQREFVLHAASELSQRDMTSLRSSAVSVMVSEQGLRAFMETGVMPEYPSEIYVRPQLPDRILMLRRYLDAIEHYTVSFRIVREVFCNTSSGTSIWIEDNCAYILFMNELEDRKYMSLQDPDMIAALRDFIMHMEPDLCFNEEDSLSILRSILQEYVEKSDCS